MIEINNTDNGANTVDNNMHEQEKPVNESTGMYVRGFLKITDPDTGDVLVQTAD